MNDKIIKLFIVILLFVLGSAAVLFILPSFTARLIFFLFALGVVVWTAMSGPRVDVSTLGLITAYVLALGQFGLNFYYPRTISPWLLMIFTFVWITALFWLNFSIKLGKVPASAKLTSLVSGLVGAEIVLALLFWPTHFLVLNTVLFVLFYLAWMTSSFYMTGLLNWHRIMIHVIFTGLIILVVLLTAQWTI